jgi:hypothetical protein
VRSFSCLLLYISVSVCPSVFMSLETFRGIPSLLSLQPSQLF